MSYEGTYYLKTWGYKDGKLYSFLKDLKTGKIVNGTWTVYSPLEKSLEKDCELVEGVCGLNAKPENQGKKFTAYKMKGSGDFVQGTWQLVADEIVHEQ